MPAGKPHQPKFNACGYDQMPTINVLNRVGSSLTRKYQTRLEWLVRDKQSSLFNSHVTYKKTFIAFAPGDSVINNYSLPMLLQQNKLECLSVKRFFRLISYLRLPQEWTRFCVTLSWVSSLPLKYQTCLKKLLGETLKLILPQSTRYYNTDTRSQAWDWENGPYSVGPAC